MKEISNEMFDKLNAFLFDAVLDDDEVRESLTEAGVDMTPAYERLREMIDRYRGCKAEGHPQ